jgi:glycine betaine/proline transport system substrate-binding protein
MADLPAYEKGDTDPAMNRSRQGWRLQPPGNVSKVAWKGMKDKWPGAYKVLEAMSIDNGLQQKLILEVDNKGRDIKEVIAEWMNQNESVWQDWINKATS